MYRGYWRRRKRPNRWWHKLLQGLTLIAIALVIAFIAGSLASFTHTSSPLYVYILLLTVLAPALLIIIAFHYLGIKIRI